MALIQISEPGQSAQKKQKKFAVGIDLGTTNSLVAVMNSDDVLVIPDDAGDVLIPSVVRYTKEATQVGRIAKEAAVLDPENTIVSVKRLMGRGADDIKQVAQQTPYQLAAGDGMVKIKTKQGEVSPVEVSADILKQLKTQAENAFSRTVEGAVITVPAYFDETQRQATKDAAKLAGINVLRLLNEPTAAAVAYGLDQGGEGLHIVYDWGGGTFDVSVLNFTKGIFEVLSTGGNAALGGDDMDYAIAEWVLVQRGEEKPLSPSDLRALLTIARETKEALTHTEKETITFNGQSFELTRACFNQLIETLVEETLAVCSKTVRDAEIEFDAIVDVVLVGGSTRIPYVRDKVEALFQKKPLASIDPDQVVAMGAAIQADVLAGNRSGDDVLLLDVIPLSLGIEIMGELMEKLVHRNTSIPVKRAQEFTTYQDNQTGMMIHVLQGERELIQDCRSLARFELTGIPPMKAGAARVLVTFQIDADGLLSVFAKEVATGKETQVMVKPSYGLKDEEIEIMLQKSFEHAGEDREQRALAEEIVAGNQLLAQMEAAMQESADALLTGTEKNTLCERTHALLEAIKQKNRHTIHAEIQALDTASQTFAQRRMDVSMRDALSGKNIEDITDANN